MEKMEYKAWKESLKEIPMVDVCHSLGLKVRRSGKSYLIYCPEPNHNDRHMGSCRINEQTNRYYCFACGVGGDNIRLVQNVLNYDFQTATDYLADMSGQPNYAELTSATPTSKKKRVKPVPVPNEILELIGLQTGTSYAFKQMSYSLSKPESGRYEDDLDEKGDAGYICQSGSLESFSIRDLWESDPDAFWMIVLGKVRESYPMFQVLYETRFWDTIQQAEIKDTLEYALKTLEPLAKKAGIYQPTKKSSKFQLVI